MARRFTIEVLMNLAKSIGANPQKFMGTKTNISFLGKGPTKNPLFQMPLEGIDQASMKQLGPGMIPAVEDAMAYATAGKLNSIQMEILGKNILGVKNVMHPPVLPSASVSRFPGITGIPRGISPGESLYNKRTGGIKSRNPIVDDRGRTWDFKTKLPEPGPEDLAAFSKALNQKTGMSRAIARQILQQDTRLKLNPEELFMLRTGKGEPLDLMRKYYGKSMMNLDAFLDDVISRPGMNIKDIATRVLSEVELIPQFASGGLAEIMQAPRSGYSKGRLVKGALAILNRNKKNAEYMFKASDNVSPGYARGDLKYNAELLAEQLAEDAGILYEDLGALEQTKFYGTAYDYLAAEMGKNLLRKRNLAKVTQALGTGEDLSGVSPAYGEKYANQLLMDWKPGKGRKPSASGGLAGILEV